MSIKTEFVDALSSRVLMLDGAMGTMIQCAGLSEEQFRGSRFASHHCNLAGCNDLLALTAPDVIEAIHREYLAAGADVVETDSFNANGISLADYSLQDYAYEINLAAATVARRAADSFSTPGRRRYVAGSVGLSNRSLSISPDIENPAARATDWDTMVEAYRPQFRGLIDGGVDFILIETIFDTLNAKAIAATAREVMAEKGVELPILFSITLTESGRVLSGQTIEAFIASVEHFRPAAIGLNCGFGASSMLAHYRRLAECAPCPVFLYPNAGLPNEMGQYDETPEKMVADLEQILKDGSLNMIGGCCGTTPQHIAMIAERVRGLKPRVPQPAAERLTLSGLEMAEIVPERNFVNIGERCNVAGSRKFLRLINEKQYEEAATIARGQVENGAQIIDINVDDAMLDSVAEMSNFLRLISSDPDIARVPFMIDSSDWNVITTALKTVQGKPIVNSISLKDGEAEFCRKAAYIRNMGAAVVVMAFDEEGQAVTFKHKIDICARAYSLLVEKVHFPATDIIFDPNILAVATGIAEHNRYGIDFLDALSWIKSNLPHAKVSGGLSNLSFSFRGNNYVRAAIHSVFLYHAVARGMDMAIVNAGAIPSYDDIPENLRSAIEDVLLDSDSDAPERLIQIAGEMKEGGAEVQTECADTSSLPVDKRIAEALLKGREEDIPELLQLLIDEGKSPMEIIDGALMDGMNRVGVLFGEGKLFLPQVVKSARAMKHAVDWLKPYMPEADSDNSSRATVVIATVKGDVHDIGKNIVAVVLRCNGFNVIDLGTMVPLETILDAARTHSADIIALSGLITPSLEEMRRVAAAMQQAGMTIPLMIGGATTSALHTAVKIAPEYSGVVAYTRDAAEMPSVAHRLLSDAAYVASLKESQEALRRNYEAKKNLVPLVEARSRAARIDWSGYVAPVPLMGNVDDLRLTVDEVVPYINWVPFFALWQIPASLARVATIGGCDHCRAQWLASVPTADVNKAAQAMQLYKDALRVIRFFAHNANDSITARVRFFDAHADGDDILVGEKRLPMLRSQASDGSFRSLADYVSPTADKIAAFAVTAGSGIESAINRKKELNDEYEALLYQAVSDRLVEAAAECFHRRVRTAIWGYAPDEAEPETTLLRNDYSGIRPAVGYPSLPDQSLIFDLDSLLDLASIGISLSENGAMTPLSSICGLMISHPQSAYFYIGTIGDDQREDYADRRNVSLETLSRFLPL